MKVYKLSNQAIGALMMALQKGLMEQSDITEMLREFDLISGKDGLVVENPPIIKLDDTAQTREEDIA
jgi:hypothetical protein